MVDDDFGVDVIGRAKARGTARKDIAANAFFFSLINIIFPFSSYSTLNKKEKERGNRDKWSRAIECKRAKGSLTGESEKVGRSSK